MAYTFKKFIEEVKDRLFFMNRQSIESTLGLEIWRKWEDIEHYEIYEDVLEIVESMQNMYGYDVNRYFITSANSIIFDKWQLQMLITTFV
jgi:hypothetical protein